MKRTGTGNPLPHHTRAPHPPIGDYKHFKHWLYFTLLALAPLLELCWCLNWYNFIGWVPRRSGGVPKVHPAHEVKRKKKQKTSLMITYDDGTGSTAQYTLHRYRRHIKSILIYIQYLYIPPTAFGETSCSCTTWKSCLRLSNNPLLQASSSRGWSCLRRRATEQFEGARSWEEWDEQKSA